MPLASEPTRRPPLWEETLSLRLFLWASPRLPRAPFSAPPRSLAPWEPVEIPRSAGPGVLHGSWFPASGTPRGAVLLAPPWHRRGRAYFHRRGRLRALRDAGYHSLTVDLPEFGGSGSVAGYFDRDLTDAALHLDRLCPDLPLHFWGVSSGGYWAHPMLARNARFRGAFFEDVSPHLLEWSWRIAPWGRPFYLFFQGFFRRAYRFLDARRHAVGLRAARAAYVGGGADPGIPATDLEQLADRAGAAALVVPGAGHLDAIRRDPGAILELALETFDEATRA